ncbi:hypothetical protein [Nonomuraea sp. MG754425]|uniref:hypothetical protein n=1 Tax=Nonomuraea sp. MG754425 TaxID=2570319 RepID=UPI001F35574D|nr:hypothetical protein [Nonomuraea sp. MG754425]
MTKPIITSTSTSTASTSTNSSAATGPATVGSSSVASAPDTQPGLRLFREGQDAGRGHLPLSVWLAAADAESVASCRVGCCHPVSGPLARHLVAACTRLGNTVVHLGASDHQVVSAALTAGCLPVAVFADVARAGVSWSCLARTHPDYDLEVADLRVADPGDDAGVLADFSGSAGLVVAEQTCQQPVCRSTGRPDFGAEAEVFDVARAAGLVKPGGHLVVITGLHREGGVVDPVPEIIARARQAGLVYLQHIIALRNPAHGERIDPDLSHRASAAIEGLPECAGLPASARVHADVLLFSASGATESTGSTERGGGEG